MKKKIVLKMLEKEKQDYFEEIGLDIGYNL